MIPSVSVRLIAVLAALVIGLVLAGAGLALWQSRSEAEAYQRREVANLALAVQRDMTRLFTAADQTLQQAAQDIAARDDALADAAAMHEYLRSRRFAVPEVRAMFVYGGDGRLIANSLRPVSPQPPRPPEYVLALRNPTANEPFVGAPLAGPLTGRMLVPVARRLMSRDGRVAGTIGLALEPDILAAYYASLNLAPGTRIGVLREDGTALMSWPDDGTSVPHDRARLAATPVCDARGDGSAATPAANLVLATCRLPGWNLVVAAAAERAQAHALARGSAWRIAVATTVACAALLVLFIALGTLARRHERERARREEAQALAARDKARYENMFTLLPEVVTVTDIGSGRYVDVNDAFTAILGYSRAETLGRTSIEMGIWVDAGDREALVSALREGPAVRDFPARFRARDGRVINAVCSGMLTEVDGQRLLTLVSRDITSQLAVERDASEARTWLRTIFDTAPVGIVVTAVDADEVLHFNEAAAAMYGLPGPAAQYIGRSGAEFGFWKSEEHRRAAFAPVLASPGGLTFEHPLAGADGVRRWIRNNAVRITMHGRDCVLAIMQDATDRHAADMALRDSNERFSRVFQSAPAPTVIIDLATQTYADVNQAWCDFTGHARADVLGRKVSETNTIVDMEERDRMFALVAAGNSVRGLATRYRRKDGSIAEVLGSLELLALQGQSMLIASFVDLTDLRAAEAALRRRDRELLALLGGVPIAVASVDRDHVCRACNVEYANLYGKRPEDLIGTPLADISRGTYELVRPYVERVQGGELVRFERPHDTVPERILEAVLVPKSDEAGSNDGWFAVVTDITERKLAQQRLEAEKDRLARLFDLIPEPVVVFDVDSMSYAAVNRSWELTFGHSREATVGHKPEELDIWLSPQQRQTLHRLHPNAEASVNSHEIALRARNGEFIECELSTTPEIDFGGQRARIAVMRDVTAQRRAEREVRKLNAELERRVAERTAELTAANEELQSFTYTVSHDLRAPLRSVAGFAQILRDDHSAELGADARRLLGLVSSGAVRMAELIDALLALSRLSRNELVTTDVDLSALAELVLAELRHAEPGRRVETLVESGLRVRADPGMMRSLLQNLLGNAWKYSARTEVASIRFGRTRASGTAEFFVADNGIGFDMRYAGRMFEVFQRMHQAEDFEGIGVGLATVKRIVDRHGGRIRAEGRPGHGATFYFTLD